VSNERAQKFLAIEGLRGWLAWAVVFTHLTYMSAFDMKGLSWFFRSIGLPSVQIFIIVSGFVVTHVILEKQDSYIPFLVKRFARIFPLLAITCFIGFFTSDLLAVAISDKGFRDPEFAKLTAEVAASNHSQLLLHLLAHLFMLHALIPNDWLAYSEYAFNLPAWSISLEWQFYLIAPLIVFILLQRRSLIIPLAVAVAVLEIAYRKVGSGTFEPGALPLSAIYFAVGILSRLAYLERPGQLIVAAAFAIIVFPVSEFRPFLIWLVVFSGLSLGDISKPDIIERAYKFALLNRLMLYFGSRSYSIYLCHYPVISIVVWLLAKCLSVHPNMLLLTCMSLPLIVLVSEFAHRWVELPGIAAGRRVALAMQGMEARPDAPIRAVP
jgi:peptidoglycan/LPS O-acetylase OafA/YrhL